MSLSIGKFTIPYTDDLPCRSPDSREVVVLRDAGLEPTDWLVVEIQAHLPFLVLKKRGGTDLAVLEGIFKGECSI